MEEKDDGGPARRHSDVGERPLRPDRDLEGWRHLEAQIPSTQRFKLAAVVKGACWLAVDGERAPVRLETGGLQTFRRLVTRYERRAATFAGFLHLACAIILLRHL